MPLYEHLGDRVTPSVGERAAHGGICADVVPWDEDAVAVGTIQHVYELLIERAGVGAFIAEPHISDPDCLPNF